MAEATSSPPPMFPGTQGYAEQAPDLIARYEAVAFDLKYRSEWHLIPAPPSPVLDIGAGPGADAAWLAARGHPVTAVEPVAAFRDAGQVLHHGAGIEWVDDGLPDLRMMVAGRRRFGLILLNAVWMHLAPDERQAAMPVVASLLAPAGVLLLSLRHGPVPEGRRMFDVSAAETAELGQAAGLVLLSQQRGESLQPENRAAGVSWTKLAFRAAPAA